MTVPEPTTDIVLALSNQCGVGVEITIAQIARDANTVGVLNTRQII